MRRWSALLAATLTLVLAPTAPALAGNKGGGNFCPGRNNSCPSNGGGGGGGGKTTDVCTNKADGQIVVFVGGVTVSIL